MTDSSEIISKLVEAGGVIGLLAYAVRAFMKPSIVPYSFLEREQKRADELQDELSVSLRSNEALIRVMDRGKRQS